MVFKSDRQRKGFFVSRGNIRSNVNPIFQKGSLIRTRVTGEIVNIERDDKGRKIFIIRLPSTKIIKRKSEIKLR